ncbi:hypothetical protein SAMN02745126_00477 [Enhydrobacter aerosaccus]|uniref:Ribbon-helix-helix domain-containing protein n=1 Tax=Enhydrobacter aerosaccus TaxID=225324 RepID=A0A1T4JU90_9HYPH|nr:hypothetical protein [Enhydrobacter aerosaccus]SJZ33782.1 hypothetical protein SAMN02745126_00477 [Enhydrobacter aerosaccus]
MKSESDEKIVERVQTGVRIEKRILKVAKGLAEYLDMSLGDLVEGVLLNAFEGKDAFSPATRERIKILKDFYGLTLNASDAHTLRDRAEP